VSILFGLVAAAVSSVVTSQIANAAFANAGSSGRAITLLLAVLAGAGGLLAGSAAFRRARRTHQSLALFSALAFAFSFGLVGVAFMVALTYGYTSAYGSTAGSGADAVTTLLAYPVFGALGGCLGSLAGWAVGLVASGALRVVAPASR
jgi:hypothetical protein